MMLGIGMAMESSMIMEIGRHSVLTTTKEIGNGMKDTVIKQR
jgi:hypothetical protein